MLNKCIMFSKSKISFSIIVISILTKIIVIMIFFRAALEESRADLFAELCEQGKAVGLHRIHG